MSVMCIQLKYICHSQQDTNIYVFLYKNFITAFILHKQDTLVLNVLPKSKMLSRNAALTIFPLETLRTLEIDMANCSSRSEEFYMAMSEVASSAKVLCMIF